MREREEKETGEKGRDEEILFEKECVGGGGIY